MKFSYLKATLAAAALLCSISAANAGLISGAHWTIGGKGVALQGYEWMSLDHTAGLSRATIENVNGFTDRYGTKWNAGDWVYASRTQTEVLMNSIWGGIYDGWANESVDGSKWFLENFGELYYDTWAGTTRTDGSTSNGFYQSYFFFGNDGECGADVGTTCEGLVKYQEAYLSQRLYQKAYNGHTRQTELSNIGGGPVAYVSDAKGYNTLGSPHNESVDKLTMWNGYGSLLLRATDVPEPSTLAIFALGMIGLASRRFKKQS
jgi:hypothetical protein